MPAFFVPYNSSALGSCKKPALRAKREVVKADFPCGGMGGLLAALDLRETERYNKKIRGRKYAD